MEKLKKIFKIGKRKASKLEGSEFEENGAAAMSDPAEVEAYVASLKVVELKDELKKRHLSYVGNKPALAQRLREDMLKSLQQTVEEEEEDEEEEEEEEDARPEAEQSEKEVRMRRAQLATPLFGICIEFLACCFVFSVGSSLVGGGSFCCAQGVGGFFLNRAHQQSVLTAEWCVVAISRPIVCLSKKEQTRAAKSK